MSLDRHAAERRRFARLLGIDGEAGCGLPIGSRSSHTDGTVDSETRNYPKSATRSATTRIADRSHDS
ncbi:hypothetical protein [Natronorubrum thiooxidans]|uniref:Uncharacterized protein n=1 Tax=Natronorubrum thiooxidans TaxID=308853 RepID=A0A1N7DMS6_9EURY|nr:hypothetical protein [Natronorubrum thiooxidans]SIR77162.1 hypothetical protein SAMN05421752_102386 [Natronorubrum thiooxidans]